MLFCGLDVGTSGIKAVVFDEKGNVAAEAERMYVLELKSDGTRTLSASDIWNKARAVLAEVAAKTEGEISSIAVSSFGEAFVCVDGEDNELSEVMIYTDRRGEKEYFEAMQKSSDLEIAQICGLPPSTTYSISKILHIKHNLPDIYEKTKRLLLIEDYINYRLTGEAVGDHSVACRTMLFDVHKRQWSGILLDKFGIDGEKLSTMVHTGDVIGKISEKMADKIGLPYGVQVVAGGHDQTMAALGAGAGAHGTVDSMGTSECLTPIFRGALSPEATLQSSLCSEGMWADDVFCSLAYNATSGLLVKWFFDTFNSESEKPQYPLFEKNMPKEPTKLFVQPYMMGSGTPYNDHRARFALIGGDAGTTRYEIYRAVLEGLALDMRLNREKLVGEGVKIDRIICVGGGAQSAPWLKIKADAMQAEVATLTCKQAGALGCAVAGAYALGCYAGMEEAGKNMARLHETIAPETEYKNFYDEKYGLYQELHNSLKKYCEFATK